MRSTWRRRRTRHLQTDGKGRDVELALSAVFGILILILLLVIFVPAWLERTSRGNIARRDEYYAKLADLHRDARRLERSLHSYERTRSAAYRSAALAAGERLQHLTDLLAAAGSTLDSLHCPPVYDYLLPIQHFFNVPSDAGIFGERWKRSTSSVRRSTPS